MGKRDNRGAVPLEAPANAARQTRDPEQAADRKTSHRDDELRADDLELPVAPERAQLALARRRRAIAAAGGWAARIATGDRGAVEGRVELVLLQLEPATQRSACTATPGPS